VWKMKSNSKDDNDDFCEGKIWYSAWSQAHQREYYWTTLKVQAGPDGETTFKIYSKCQWVMPDNNKILDVTTTASSLAAPPGNRYCDPCIVSDMSSSQSSPPVNIRDQQTAIVVQKPNRIRKSHRRQWRRFIAVVVASIAFVIAPIVLISGAGFHGELSSLSKFRPRILLKNHQSSNGWVKTFRSNFFFDYFFIIPAGHVVSEDGSVLYECTSEAITQPEQSNARSYIAVDSGREMTRTSVKHNVPIATLPIDKSKDKMAEHTFDEDVSFIALRYNSTRNENAYASEKSAPLGSTHSINDGDESAVLVDEQTVEKVQENRTAVKWNKGRKRCFVPLFYVLSKTCRAEPPFEDLENFLLQCMMQ